MVAGLKRRDLTALRMVVICIASAMFHAGSPMSLHYVASKGGIIGLVRSLATEVGVDGVTVNAIAPGQMM